MYLQQSQLKIEKFENALRSAQVFKWQLNNANLGNWITKYAMKSNCILYASAGLEFQIQANQMQIGG